MTISMQHRQRQESYRSVDSLTPADDLSSWLGDDVCANCGAPTRSSHLYCSQQCKEEDAKHANELQASVSAPVNAQYVQQKGRKLSTTTATPATVAAASWNESTGDKQFHYACPPSPNILAKYNSALTSPALVALERSLPKVPQNTRQSSGDRQPCSISSSEDSSAVVQKDSKRRSSSRSTFSSASDALSTDRSTPPSTAEATRAPGERVEDDRDNDEEYETDEPSDLCLPPSIQPAASILLRSNASEARQNVAPSGSTTSDGSKRSPMIKTAAASTTSIANNQTVTGTSKNDQGRMTIEFARRPSSTNLPAPVLFTSPVLSMTSTKLRGDGHSVKSRRGSKGPSQASLGHSENISRGQAVSTERPPHRSAPFSSPAAMSDCVSSASTALPMLNKTESESFARRMAAVDSPPMLESASSSAGKTLRAISPIDGEQNGLISPALCGRYGCNGVGSTVSSFEELQSHVFRGHTPQRRPSLGRSHKHTHSAAAGLSLLGSSTTPLTTKAKLQMTPVMKTQELFDEENVAQIRGNVSHTSSQLDERLKSPLRGRSKARGRRSTSRRSPSPPRGVARRGHSEDLSMDPSGQRGRQQAPPALSPSARSDPISFSQSAGCVIAELGAGDDEFLDERRRGRSPTERLPLQTSARGRAPEAAPAKAGSRAASLGKKVAEVIEERRSEEDEESDVDELEKDRGEGEISHTFRNRDICVMHNAKGYDDVDIDEL